MDPDPDCLALEALYRAHERGLYNVAYRVVWNRDDARDVVHDAFVRLWRKREGVDWSRAAALAYRVVLGIAANRRRGNAVRSALVWWRGPSAEPAPDLALDEARAEAAVRRGIDALPARLRDVLLLCTFSELDQRAMGAALGIPAGTVASRRNEAIARIKARIEEDVR